MQYDAWLQSDHAFERFHGLDEFHEDEVQRRREREERRIERKIEEEKDESKKD